MSDSELNTSESNLPEQYIKASASSSAQEEPPTETLSTAPVQEPQDLEQEQAAPADNSSAIASIWGKDGPPRQQFLIRLKGTLTLAEDGNIQTQFEGVSSDVVVRVAQLVKMRLKRQKAGVLSGLFSAWPKTNKDAELSFLRIISYHADPDLVGVAIEPGKALLLGQWRGRTEEVGCIVIQPEQRKMKAFPSFFTGVEGVEAKAYQQLGVLLKLQDGKLQLSSVLGSQAFAEAKPFKKKKTKAKGQTKEQSQPKSEATPAMQTKASGQAASTAGEPKALEEPIQAEQKSAAASMSAEPAAAASPAVEAAAAENKPSSAVKKDEAKSAPANQAQKAPPKPVQFDGVLLSSGRGASAFKVEMQMVVVGGEVKGGRTGARYRITALKQGKGLKLQQARPL